MYLRGKFMKKIIILIIIAIMLVSGCEGKFNENNTKCENYLQIQEAEILD